MKIIPLESNILSIAHNDLDGSVSQIILGHVYKNIRYIHCSFYKIDEILLSLDFNNYDYVFLTDIHPDKKEVLYLSDKIVLIDHHKSAETYHNPSKNHYVIFDKNICASVLTKMFVEKMYNINLFCLNSLVYLTNDYDMWILKNCKSKLLNDVMFYLYRPAKFREVFFNGRTRFTYEEIEWLKKRREMFKEIYKNIEVYEFDKINGCVIEAEEFINEIAHKLMKEENYQIIFVRNPKTQRVSVRHNITNLDMGNILKSYGWGGGHELSAGFWVSSNEDFKTKIEILEKEIYNIINIQK